jgi:hypothetical protein
LKFEGNNLSNSPRLLSDNGSCYISSELTIPEDFICLVILNKDDSNFKLFELANRKNAFLKQVVKQFLRQNSSTVASELSIVSKQKFSRIKINKNDI